MPANDEISEYRKKIDDIDNQILCLLNKRASISLFIRKIKQSINIALFSPEREEEIISNLCKYNDGPLFNENVKEIFQKILKIMRELPDDK